eukprot:CAMPEP_0113307790 /NCGR_PEP_ID=MMETSP0010_2-20120614/6494_1 /TAXON_ID=216773 ORGANISM="Corethron hystrix, Strain 308" /NCGR_SAMPLE_ID=MMETSP0010_2 /ASSEMBLY_ACC=CAM_ASM_000155 /LENGTH=786 /DNA_ID=CAMNT_0000162715 /DNA_START=385 /DNA_END=2745 /DNA_ORIENTATION=+ /assembly_acc=CAM_ASM_000155
MYAGTNTTPPMNRRREEEMEKTSARAFDLKLELYYLEQREKQLRSDAADEEEDDESHGSGDESGDGHRGGLGDGDSSLTPCASVTVPFCGSVRENPLDVIARLREELNTARKEVDKRDAVLVQVSSSIKEARDSKLEAERRATDAETRMESMGKDQEKALQKMAVEYRKKKEKVAANQQKIEKERERERTEMQKKLDEIQGRQKELEIAAKKWRERHDAMKKEEKAAKKHLERVTLERDLVLREKGALKVAFERERETVARDRSENNSTAALQKDLEDMAIVNAEQVEKIARLRKDREDAELEGKTTTAENLRLSKELSSARAQISANEKQLKSISASLEQKIDEVGFLKAQHEELKERNGDNQTEHGNLNLNLQILQSENDLMKRHGLAKMDERQKVVEDLVSLCETQRAQIETLEQQKQRRQERGYHSKATSESEYEVQYITQLQSQNESLVHRLRELETKSEAQLCRARKELEEITRMYKRQGVELLKIREKKASDLSNGNNCTNNVVATKAAKEEGEELEAALRQVAMLREKFREESLANEKRSQTNVDLLRIELLKNVKKITRLEMKVKDEQLAFKNIGIDKTRIDFDARIDQLDIALTKIGNLVSDTKALVSENNDVRQSVLNLSSSSIETCKLSLLVDRLPNRLDGLDQMVRTLLQANQRVSGQVQQLGRDLKVAYRNFRKATSCARAAAARDQRVESVSPSSSLSSETTSVIESGTLKTILPDPLKVNEGNSSDLIIGAGTNSCLSHNVECFRGEKKMMVTQRSINEISKGFQNLRQN